MAARHVTQYDLKGLTIQQFAIMLMEASHSLKWHWGSVKGGFSLTVPRSVWSYGETLVIKITDGVAVIESKNSRWQLTGSKKNERNLVDLIQQLHEARLANTPGQLAEKYAAIEAEQDAYAKGLEERMQTGSLTGSEKISLGVGGRYVTYTLIGLNILVFILMVIWGAGFMEFSVDSMYKWGGNVRELTAHGEWYRLLTNIFLHGGLVHVAFNMYALLFVGIYLEPLLGRWRYLTVYIACGILASLTSVWWSDERISVGASGAIFGLYGVFLALLTTNYLEKDMRKPMLQSIGIFVVYNLVYGMKGGIDNAAHIGGLLSGAVFGYIYYFIFSKKKDNGASFIVTVALVICVVTYIVLPLINSRPQSDQTKFGNSMERFGILEENALKPLHKLNDSSFSPALAEEFKTISLPAWNECRLLLDSADNYNVPAELKERNGSLKRYVDLRIKEFQLFVQRESEKTNSYDDEINKTNGAIKLILDSLNTKK